MGLCETHSLVNIDISCMPKVGLCKHKLLNTPEDVP